MSEITQHQSQRSDEREQRLRIVLNIIVAVFITSVAVYFSV